MEKAVQTATTAEHLDMISMFAASLCIPTGCLPSHVSPPAGLYRLSQKLHVETDHQIVA